MSRVKRCGKIFAAGDEIDVPRADMLAAPSVFQLVSDYAAKEQAEKAAVAQNAAAVVETHHAFKRSFQEQNRAVQEAAAISADRKAKEAATIAEKAAERAKTEQTQQGARDRLRNGGRQAS